MARQNKLNAALKIVRGLIESLIPLPSSSEISHFDLFFSRAEEGSISLGDEEAQRYRHCLRNLWDAVSQDEQISARAVERLLQDAIFMALDIRKKRSSDFGTRLDGALRELETRLTSDVQRFFIYLSVNGLDSEGLPKRVGNVEFVVFGDDQLNKFREAVAKHDVDEKQLMTRRQGVEKLREKRNLGGRVVGGVEVAALEGGAAESLATRELRLTIDVVNFYSDMIPYNHAHLSLPGDADFAQVVIPKLVVAGSQRTNVSISHSSWGRLGELSLPKLLDLDSRRNLGFARVNNLLSGRRNDLENKIIASIQWAGRATAEIRKEEAFLLYAIALESLVLSDNNPVELSYRLRVRTAHLLADEVASRQDVFSKLGDLYKIRSKIVHSGHYQVTDADLGLIRSISKAALVRICTGTEFLSMKNVKELGKWFQDCVLA